MASSVNVRSHPVVIDSSGTGNSIHEAGHGGLKELLPGTPRRDEMAPKPVHPDIKTVVDPSDGSAGQGPMPGVRTGPALERASVAAILGPAGLERASVVQITPQTTAGAPKISAPHGTPGESKAHKSMLVDAWDRLMEFTPGTNQHKRTYGTRWSLGTYRFTSTKR